MLIFSVTTDRDPCGPGVSVTANSVDITHGPGIESPGGLVLRLGVQDTGKASHVPETIRVGPVAALTVVSARLRGLHSPPYSEQVVNRLWRGTRPCDHLFDSDSDRSSGSPFSKNLTHSLN